MPNLILSPYTFLFEYNNEGYLFNSESLFFSKIDKDSYILLSNRDFSLLDKEALDLLKKKRILIFERDKDTLFYHIKTEHLTSAYSGESISLIISPTTGCNFACPYCFEPKKNPKSITPIIEEKIIQYLKKRENIKRLSLTWYGGEPLLCPDAIRRIYDRIVSETDMEIVENEIISNTYLVTEGVIDMLRHCKITKIQVSLDGTEINHNKTRFLKKSHKPTYKIIEQNIEKIAKELPNIIISIRVNINKNNWKDFAALYKYYQTEEWHKNIWIYPGYIREDGATGRSLCYSSFDAFEIVELYQKFADLGVNIDLFPRKRLKGCMLQRSNAFIIGPEGELYKCWNDVSNPDKIIGSVTDNHLHNYDILMRYMQECSPIREECRNCIALPICDGGCGYLQFRNKFENGEFELCSPYKNKEVLKNALLFGLLNKKNENLKTLRLH